MNEADWLACNDPQAMLPFLRDSGKLTERKARLFAVACCRRFWHLLKRKGSREAVEVAERYAEGQADETGLTAARSGALKVMLALERSAALYNSEARDLARAADTVCCQPAADIAQKVAKQTADSYGPLRAEARERAAQAVIVRDLFGPVPFRAPPAIPSSVRTWNYGTILRLATASYAERSLPAGTLDNARLAVLADALEEAGCQEASVLTHLRGQGSHWRGCWVLDWLLNKA
jgi:hypothetical protein